MVSNLIWATNFFLFSNTVYLKATLSNYNRTPSIYKVMYPNYYKYGQFTHAATIDHSCLAYYNVTSIDACH